MDDKNFKTNLGPFVAGHFLLFTVTSQLEKKDLAFITEKSKTGDC